MTRRPRRRPWLAIRFFFDQRPDHHPASSCCCSYERRRGAVDELRGACCLLVGRAFGSSKQLQRRARKSAEARVKTSGVRQADQSGADVQAGVPAPMAFSPEAERQPGGERPGKSPTLAPPSRAGAQARTTRHLNYGWSAASERSTSRFDRGAVANSPASCCSRAELRPRAMPCPQPLSMLGDVASRRLFVLDTSVARPHGERLFSSYQLSVRSSERRRAGGRLSGGPVSQRRWWNGVWRSPQSHAQRT